MLAINDSLDKIQQSLQELNAPSAGSQGKTSFSLKSIFSKLQDLFHVNERKMSAEIVKYIRTLNQFEKIPVLFDASAEAMEEQTALHDKFIHLKRIIKPILKKSSSPLAAKQWTDISTKVAALNYRLEGVNGGMDKGRADLFLFEALVKSALKWKHGLELMVEKELSANQIEKLEIAASYHKFAKVILSDSSMLKRFFTWALRDNNGVDQFVQFPATCSRVKSAFLSARTGRFGGEMFRIDKISQQTGSHTAQQKVISLPFYIDKKMEYISILDESREVVLTGWRLTIKQVFDIFARKNKEIGNLEFFGTQGITNWNSHQLGSWNPETEKFDTIDITADNWWEQLPVLEEISKETLEKRYHVTLEEGEWLACAKSTRMSKDLDLDGRHGYFEISIPTEEGKYRVYPFGNFAAVFPNGVIRLLRFLVATVIAKIAFPDENFFYSQRQQASFPIKLLVEQGKKIMKIIQIDAISARHGFMIFQFGGRNCSFWAQDFLESVVDNLPNFFKMPIVQSNPNNLVLKGIFKLFRATPKIMQKRVIGLVEEFLGASKGLVVFEPGQKTYISHKGSPIFEEQAIYQPGLLHMQIEENKLEGVIKFGHDE